MAEVDIEVNGREYRVTCDDGQEERLRQLAAYFNRYVTQLADNLGQIGDARLMLLSALTVCDELYVMKERVIELQQDGATMDEGTASAAGRAVDAAAERVEEMARMLDEA